MIDDVIYTGRTIKAALEALHLWGRAKRVTLVAMVDRSTERFEFNQIFVGVKYQPLKIRQLILIERS